MATLASPDHFEGLLGPLPAGTRLLADPRAGGPFDVIVAFVTTEAELRARFGRAKKRLRPEGGLWICWPKRTSPLATELAERHVRAHGLSTGLVDNKICAIDGDWSGLRFVVRRADRPAAHGR